MPTLLWLFFIMLIICLVSGDISTMVDHRLDINSHQQRDNGELISLLFTTQSVSRFLRDWKIQSTRYKHFLNNNERARDDCRGIFIFLTKSGDTLRAFNLRFHKVEIFSSLRGLSPRFSKIFWSSIIFHLRLFIWEFFQNINININRLILSLFYSVKTLSKGLFFIRYGKVLWPSCFIISPS